MANYKQLLSTAKHLRVSTQTAYAEITELQKQLPADMPDSDPEARILEVTADELGNAMRNLELTINNFTAIIYGVKKAN